ncbi:ATP-binding protein [Thiorhodococcus fuscus]|uniref:histidine kinase n=1 Tax=Thiorhodococcus fuscus TaxID=527200 RepID=A0ABW4YDR7_9GAMM
MIQFFRDLSMRWKVVSVVMLVIVPVLLLSTCVVMVTDVVSMRSGLAERVTALARVASINTAAALAFMDEEAAEEVFNALGSERDVLQIRIRTLDGKLFARYRSREVRHELRLRRIDRYEAAHPESMALGRLLAGEPLTRFCDDYLDVRLLVSVKGKALGVMDLQYDTGELRQRIFYQVALTSVVFLCGILLAFLLAVGLHRLISMPLNAVAGAMENLAARRDYSIRLDVGRADELGTLIRAFNGMLEQIQLRDEDLRQARDAAEAGSLAKSQFLAVMSHEIRTPMNGIIGMAELLSGTQLDERQRHFVRTIQVSAESLLDIISDVLDFSKIEAGRLELERVEFDLHSLMGRISDLLSETARRKGLELITRISPHCSSRVLGDPGRLRQILMNLVSNAVKFTEAGYVQLSLSCLEETDDEIRIRIAVKDTGIGLSFEEQSRIFDRFSQADSSTSRRYGGTGLGLAISKQLVELMHGTLTLDSLPGHGSLFQIELNLPKASPGPSGQALDLKGLRVLLVDGDRDGAARLIDDCSVLGIEVLQIPHLGEAMALALTQAAGGNGFSLFVLDEAQLPPLDLPVGRVLRDLIDQAMGAVLLCERESGGAKPPGWDGLECLVRPMECHVLTRALGAMIHSSPLGEDRAFSAPDRQGGERPSLGLRVLVAEDNPVNQDVIDSMLSVLGCKAVMCADGQALLAELARSDYDLVLMDCQMPLMDGYETTRRLRSREQTRGSHLPVIALTAYAMEGDRERAMAAGMDDYLVKPFKLADLAKMLRRWTASG